jgi:hypothetical protein
VEKPRVIIDLTGFYTGSEDIICVILDRFPEKLPDYWAPIGSLPAAATGTSRNGLFSDSDPEDEDNDSDCSYVDDSVCTTASTNKKNTNKHPVENGGEENPIYKRLRSSCGYEEEEV